MSDTINVLLASLDGWMREIAEGTIAAAQRTGRLSFPDAGAAELNTRLSRIRAKDFISTGEVALLLSCSDGHVRNLVKRARKSDTRFPIPFRDLDGVVVFKLDELLAWSEIPKAKLKALPSAKDADTLPALLRAATPRKGHIR